MRRLTKAQPIGGASACSCASSIAYSGGTASGMVAMSCATFMIGPLSPPSMRASSAACAPRSTSRPSAREPIIRAARPPTPAADPRIAGEPAGKPVRLVVASSEAIDASLGFAAGARQPGSRPKSFPCAGALPPKQCSLPSAIARPVTPRAASLHRRVPPRRAHGPAGPAGASALLTHHRHRRRRRRLYFGRDIFVPLALADAAELRAGAAGALAAAPACAAPAGGADRGRRWRSSSSWPSAAVVAWQVADLAAAAAAYQQNIEAKIDAFRESAAGRRLFERAAEMVARPRPQDRGGSEEAAAATSPIAGADAAPRRSRADPGRGPGAGRSTPMRAAADDRRPADQPARHRRHRHRLRHLHAAEARGPARPPDPAGRARATCRARRRRWTTPRGASATTC